MQGEINNKRFFNIGFAALVLLGFFVHMAFDLSGNAKWAALFFPVNESVWEHMKLAYMALFMWGIAEIVYFRGLPRNFFIAKTLSYVLMNGLILIVFYGYHLIVDRVYVIIDITSYVAGCWLAQKLSFRLYHSADKRFLNTLCAALFVVAGLLNAWFAFQPPGMQIFKDGPTGTYGYYRIK